MNKFKKVLIITTNRMVTWGGSEILWINAANEFLKQGCEVRICLFKTNKALHPRIADLLNKGCKIYFIREWRFPFDFIRRWIISKINYFPFFDSFKPELVVISLNNHAKTLNWPSECLKRNIHYVLIFQLVYEELMNTDPIYRREIISAKTNYFVSKDNKAILSRQLCNKLNNSKIIFNAYQVPFDVPFFYPLVDDYFNFAVVARIEFLHKGLDYLFEALNQDKWRSRKIKVNIYGDGPSLEYLKELKEFYNLNMVNFMGYIDNVVEIWKTNHALILTSRREGMSLSLIEAMLCGRVPIVTNVGGATEIIEDNYNGFIAKATNSYFIDEALERAWNNRKKLEEIGYNAYLKIRSVIPKNPAKDLVFDLLS